MYRMLIVDDVSIIVDSLFDLFMGMPQMEMELYKAYSAVEALEVLKRTKIDIVLTDIKMPKITGLEMLGQIRKQWPRCKVIFLTSYNDFDYVQEAIASGGFDYLLKTGGDPAIIQSVEKAIAALKEETAMEHLIGKTQQQLKASLPALQKEFLWELLQGKRISPSMLETAFEDMNMPLSVGGPVTLLIGRVDNWKSMMNPSDKALVLYAIQNIVLEYLSPVVKLVHVPFDQTKILWFIQPLGDTEEHSIEGTFRFLMGTLESIQASCREVLKIPVSFILSSLPVTWYEIADHFQHLKMKMSWGLGLRNEMLLTDKEPEGEFENGEIKLGSAAGKLIPFNQIGALSQYLDNNQKGDFFELFDEIMGAISGENSAIQERLVVYYGLASILLSQISRWSKDLDSSEQKELRLDKLSANPELDDWDETAGHLTRMAQWIFDHKKEEQTDQAQAIIFKIHSFIQANLAGDISLTRLADLVGLNPSYLSRLYKEITGTVLSDYISEIRIQTAARLLRENVLKVHEIAVLLGYNSTFAFTRFFKSQMNMLPQEYKHSLDSQSK